MGQLLQTYLPLVIFIGIAFVISAGILLAPFVIAVRKPDPEKVSAYECGFEAFEDARMKFDVRFYLVSLLFIIFDLGRVSVSGGSLQGHRSLRLLVDDGFPRHSDRRLHL
jgi:NADH:ubiquinone oxidoreductase subunit 3 (subunit A)